MTPLLLTNEPGHRATVTPEEAFDWVMDARAEISALNSISGEHSQCSALGEHPHDATARLLREPAARACAVLSHGRSNVESVSANSSDQAKGEDSSRSIKRPRSPGTEDGSGAITCENSPLT